MTRAEKPKKPMLLTRRETIAGVVILTASAARKAFAEQRVGDGEAGFTQFLESLWQAARDAGVSRELFEESVTGLTPDPAVLSKPKSQAEFTISIPAYIAGAVTNGRIARGRTVASELAGPLKRIEARSGVPAEILVAVLGVESNFGTGTGGADVLRVLATLAWKGQRRETFADEFVAALVMMQKRFAQRSQLRGSWAGAMGQPQFLPSAYLKFAESYAGDAAPDIWTSRADSLASIGSFLAKSGWVATLPWGVETKVPQGFDYANFDLDFSQWRALGFARADGAALPASGAASLYLPAGASGPAFFITDNFEVIRQYNTSDAYALSVGLLADGIAGHAMQAPWPKVTPLSTADCKTMQQLLTQHGFYHGVIDGKLGRTSRNAVHAFQLSEGIQPADGFATKAILSRLRAK